MTATDIWTYRHETAAGGVELIDYEVEAIDGHVGKITDAARSEDGHEFVVIDTGHWIFGKHAMLPAGVVTGIDRDQHKVLVNRTKEQIKAAPELRSEGYLDENYRETIGNYYGPTGQGWHGL